MRMTFPLRLPDLVFPSDWCEGPRPTPQLAAGRAWLCGLKQVPLPLWASARGCLLSSQWHVPPGSGWGGALGKLWPCVFKMQFPLLPPPLWLGPPPRLALAVPSTCPPVHLSPSQRPSQKGPPCPPQTKQWPGDGLAATRFSVSAEPSALRTHCPPRPRPQHTEGDQGRGLLCSPLHPQDFFHLFIDAVFKKKEEELTQCCRARGSSHAPRNTPVTSDMMPKPLPTPCR